MGRVRYPYRLGSRFPARRPDSYTLDPYLVLDIPFHEGSGSLVEDRSIFKNTGTISGADWIAHGIIGPCLDFPVATDYVDCGDDSSLNPGIMSIEAWINIRSKTDWNTISSRWITPDEAYWFGLYLDVANVRLSLNEPTIYEETDDELDLATWYHIVAVHNGSTIVLYVNGSAVASTTTGTIPAAIASVSKRTGIGYNLEPANLPFDGLIDLARIYGRDLSAQESKDRYERTKR